MTLPPIIESCDDCGACCFEQESPTGDAMLLQVPDLADLPEAVEDAERLGDLPVEAMKEPRGYLKRLLNGETKGDQVCIRLDRSTRACRDHSHRPSICRDFERSSKECRGW